MGTGGAHVGFPPHSSMWGAPNMRAFGTQGADRLFLMGLPHHKAAIRKCARNYSTATHLQPTRQQHTLLPLAAAPCVCPRPSPCSVPWVDDAGNIRVNRGFRVQVGLAAAPV